MSAIFEIIFEIFGELILQLGAELLFEFGFGTAEKRRAKKFPEAKASPAKDAFVFALFGTILGFISLALFPQLFIKTPWARVFNLMVTPLLCGFLYARFSAAQRIERYMKFVNGFLFAFIMAAVRYKLAVN